MNISSVSVNVIVLLLSRLELSNENLVYTNKGRLNKSGACRILKMKTKELETFLVECRKVLEVDQFLEPDEYASLDTED